MGVRVLITGAGGPAGIGLLRALDADTDHELFAADMSPLSSGLYLVPHERRTRLPAGDDADFVDKLLQICRKWNIEVLIPTVDQELLPCAEARHRFEAAGTRVAVASAQSLKHCIDKFHTMQALQDVIPLPRFSISGPGGTISLPAIAKPRTGSGSRGLQMLRSPRDLVDIPDAYILQEYLPGEEFSVDVFGGTNATVAVPRRRLKVDSGVCVIAESFHDANLQDMAIRAYQALGLSYVANLQFRRDAEGEPRLIEINARVPGTLMLTIGSGVPMHVAIIDRAMGRAVHLPADFEDQVMVRHFEEMFTSPAALIR